MTRILANGLAAKCCAHLLKEVQIVGDDRARVPALLISSATQALVQDVFGRRDIFENAIPISRRVALWGDGAQTVDVPHSAVVISEADLVGRCGARTPVCSNETRVDTLIDTRCFGTRMATAFPVISKTVDACWIESVDCGWLFLLPGWLLAVGDASLDHSKLIADQVTSIGEPGGRFPAYPRISDPLCDADWLACGSAAMTFDPICGDGVGNAIREAILATAVIRASDHGDAESLHVHYRTRLTAGFLKHLELCRPFYAACSGDWWKTELKLLDEGIAWCRDQLRSVPPRYRLEGFDLKMIS